MDLVFGSVEGKEEAETLARIQREVFASVNIDLLVDHAGTKTSSVEKGRDL